MRCPKCKHEQKNAVECEACGVIFERYKKFQDKKKEKAAAVIEAKEKSGGLSKALQLILLVVVVAGTTYYFTGQKPSEQGQGPVVETIAEVSPVAVMPAKKTRREQPAENLNSQAASSYNTIEQARNATVSIETPWGTGSGFFISKDYIVTNKHVVVMDERKIADFKDKVLKNKRLIELEQQKLADLRRRMKQLPKGPSRSQLSIIIQDRWQQLERVIPQQAHRHQLQ